MCVERLVYAYLQKSTLLERMAATAVDHTDGIMNLQQLRARMYVNTGEDQVVVPHTRMHVTFLCMHTIVRRTFLQQ